MIFISHATISPLIYHSTNYAWEQRKLGDFLTTSKVSGHTGKSARKLTVKLWGKGVVEKIDPYNGSEHTQYYIRRAGQFIYGKLDFLHGAFGIVPKSLDKYESTLDSCMMIYVLRDIISYSPFRPYNEIDL